MQLHHVTLRICDRSVGFLLRYQTPVTFEIPQVADSTNTEGNEEGISEADADALGDPSLFNPAQSAEEEAVLKALDVADFPPVAAAAEPDVFVNPRSSLIVSNLRADFESEDLEAVRGVPT